MTTATCKRCKENITSIPQLKTKIKTCETSGCKAKTHKFQKRCAEALECSAEDFISAIETSIIFHPVKLPPSYSDYRSHHRPTPQRVSVGGSWLCIHAPLYDCTCQSVAGGHGECDHFAMMHGYD